MNFLESLLSAQGGAIAKQIGAQFGLNESQVQSALKGLVPILTGALAQNIGRGGGLDSLLGALKTGNHDRYVDDASILAQPATTTDGNNILEKLLGDKAVSREAASRTAGNTGLDSSILKKLLPIIAAAVMGGLSKQTRADNIFERAATPSANNNPGAADGLMSILKPVLDQNQDGSALDDILRMATQYLTR
ncbi:MAG: DUF937 domain-containing protein [Burkholderiaceae bacterium]